MQNSDILDNNRDKLDRDNLEEAEHIRTEISKIKRAYIKKHGIPKESLTSSTRGIAPSNPSENTHS